MNSTSIGAHELVKGYSQKRLSPRCLIKIDIKKARLLSKMILIEYNFSIKFVNPIVEHVTKV